MLDAYCAQTPAATNSLVAKMDGNRKIYQTAGTYAESNGIENWASRLKTVLHTWGLFQWWENNNCGNLSKKRMLGSDCQNFIQIEKR